MSSQNKRVSCSHCAKLIPEDSTFCPHCGSHIETVTYQPLRDFSSHNNTELPMRVLVDESIDEKVENTPIVINSVTLLQLNESDDVFLRCEFTSLSNRVIKALMISVDCFDIWGSMIDQMNDVQYLDIEAYQNSRFGANKLVKIVNSNTRQINVSLKKLMFEDGAVLECIGIKRRFPPREELSKHFASLELVQQYVRMTTSHSKWVPVQDEGSWRCTCGAVNVDTTPVCAKCGQNKSTVFQLMDEKVLSSGLEVYKENEKHLAEELRKKQEEEARKEAQVRKELEIARLEEQRRAVEKAKQDRFAVEMEAYRKEKRKKVIIWCVILLLIAGLIFWRVKVGQYRALPRNIASDTLESGFSNVYANITSIDPYYTIYTYTTKNGLRTSSDRLSRLICECKTVEGSTIWASISVNDYPYRGTVKPISEGDYEKVTFEKNAPLQLTGTVLEPEKIIDGLGKKIPDVLLVLSVEKVQN